MNPSRPDPAKFLLPEEYQVVTYAKNQPEYLPLPAIRVEDGRVATQWTLDTGELALLAAGAPITIVLHVNHGFPPMQVMVGGADLR